MEAWEAQAREGIRATIAAYAFHADHGRFDEVVELFTPGGTLEIEGVGGAVRTGRAELLAFFTGVGGDVRTAAVPGRMQHHVTGTHIALISPTKARADSYFTVMTGAGVDHWGRYRDRLTLDDGSWRFVHRLVRTDGRTPGGWADARA